LVPCEGWERRTFLASARHAVRANQDSRVSLGSKYCRFLRVEMSISLCGPVARASRICCVAAPCPAARGAGESARAGGVFVLNGHRSTYRAGFRDVSSELYEVGMRQNAVGNIDSEVVGWIAYASLRHTGAYRAVNLKHNSKEISSSIDFRSKILSFNEDTLRQKYQVQKRYGSQGGRPCPGTSWSFPTAPCKITNRLAGRASRRLSHFRL
jgi:hypothetical protein